MTVQKGLTRRERLELILLYFILWKLKKRPQVIRKIIRHIHAPATQFHDALNGVATSTAHTLYLLLSGGSLTGDLEFQKTAYYDEEYDNGSKNANFTLDWNNGNKQKVTLAGNITITFTNPGGACNLVLKVVQDGTGTRLVTWDGDVKWSGGVAPTLSVGVTDIDIVTFYFDKTSYHGAFMGDFT